MNQTKNPLFSRVSLKTIFSVQNKWHQHGVLVHTLRVVYYILKAKDFKLFLAGFLHDVGKPSTAFKKNEEDYEFDEFSFNDHEERSYQMIKNIPFISDYTKNIVRYHYLIRDMRKSKSTDFERYLVKKKIWDSLCEPMKNDLERFIIYDDLGKGNQRR